MVLAVYDSPCVGAVLTEAAPTTMTTMNVFPLSRMWLHYYYYYYSRHSPHL